MESEVKTIQFYKRKTKKFEMFKTTNPYLKKIAKCMYQVTNYSL